MTLILTTLTPAYVVQTSDRLTSKRRNGKIHAHDTFANKTIIYAAMDAVAAISYSGPAYLKDIPTDSFLADLLWGSKISTGPDGRGAGMGMGHRPNQWTIDQAVGAVKKAINAIPQWKIRQSGGIYILISGWRNGRLRPKPFYVEVVRKPSATKAAISGLGKHWPSIGKTLCIASVGASISGISFKEVLAPYRVSNSFSVQDAENVQVQITRSIAAQNQTVGKHVLSVIMINPLKSPLICRFLPAAPHRAEMISATGRREIEVGHTPWIIAPSLFQAPQLHIGHAVIDLGGIELHLIGAEPQGGLQGLGFSVRRPPP